MYTFALQYCYQAFVSTLTYCFGSTWRQWQHTQLGVHGGSGSILSQEYMEIVVGYSARSTWRQWQGTQLSLTPKVKVRGLTWNADFKNVNFNLSSGSLSLCVDIGNHISEPYKSIVGAMELQFHSNCPIHRQYGPTLDNALFVLTRRLDTLSANI